MVLASWKNEVGNTWLKIRVPMRPNGRTGWVRESALGALHTVHTRIVVNRHTLRVTLYDSGHKRFSARIGVGKASTPTPAGHFWIREKFHVAGTTIYGPAAIGTSAYAPTLSDWPGRRSGGPARHQRAGPHPRAPVARLHPPAQPRHPHALPARPHGHSGRHPLSPREPIRFGLHGQPFDQFWGPLNPCKWPPDVLRFALHS